jgi:mannan endo-1,4-beta-mannosidase
MAQRARQWPRLAGATRTATLGAASLVLLAGCLRQGQMADSESAEPPTPLTEGETPGVEPADQPSGVFMFDGKPFCFAGTNNYYLIFKPQKMVDDVLNQAKAMGLKVIRSWGYIDRGSLDGTVPSTDGDGTKDGIYFQYWDAEAKRPAYNDGPDGLTRLDYLLHKAGQLGLKIIVVLTNSWKDFGGMDQYLVWYGLNHHHEFYTSEQVRAAYQAWVTHLVNRTNSLSGVKYRDDPAIFAWELANEPRCTNATRFSSPEGWDETTITRWADEMASYVKSIDPNHLVSVGDEGFFNRDGDHWTYGQGNGNSGVDHDALLALRGVDFGTFHLYPDHWGTGWRWGHQWIEDHVQAAREAGKPTVLEEYGIQAGGVGGEWAAKRRTRSYTLWNDTVLQRGGNAALFWILSGIQEDGTLYPDYDNFTVYNPSTDAALIAGYAARFQSDARACQLAGSVQPPAGTPSPFVTVAPPPGRGASAPQAAAPTRTPTAS